MPRVPEYNQRQIALDPANTPYQTMKPTAEMFGSDVGRALTDTGKAIGPLAETLLKLAATDDDPTDQGTGTAGTPAPDLQQTQTGQTQTAPADTADLMGKGSTPLRMHASALQAHAEKMQRQDQMASAVQHLADFNQFKRATLFDPDTGFYGKSGWDAADSFAATKQSLESYAGRVVNSIRNPQTASLVRRELNVQIGGALDGMARHAAAGRRQGLDATDRLGMEDAIADGTMNYLDPAQLGAAYRRGLMHNQATITRNNLDARSAEQAAQDYNTQFFAPVIRQFASKGDIAGARRVLARQAGNITPAAHAQLDHYLAESGLNQQAQLLTDGILQSRPDQADSAAQAFTPPSPPDLAARLSKVAEIEDPDLRQRVEANITLATQQEKQAYLANQRQLKSQAKDILDRGGGITSIPYQIYTGIDPAGKAALSAYAKAGGKVETDPVAYYNLKNLALDDPQAFLDVDLNDHLGEIDAKDLATLDRLQQSLRRGTPDPQLDLERVYKDNIDRTLRGLDLSATDIAKLYHQIDRDLAGYQAATGRKATPAEQQQMADQAVIDMKRDQRSFVMTRYGGIIPTTGKAASANGNPLIIQTAGGDMQFANDAEPQQVQEEGSLKGLFEGQEMLVSGPAPATDRWRDEGVRDGQIWRLPYPNGDFKPSYTGEMKTMGLHAKQAEAAIRYLPRASYWPVVGDHALNKSDGRGQGDGRFGLTRPSNKKGHQGLDITAAKGTPVAAVNDGEVVRVINNVQGRGNYGYGNEVVIRHADGTYTQYAHLNPAVDANGKIFKDANGKARIILKVGDKVSAGQQIAETGKTGNAMDSKDAHLHFEVRYGSSGVSSKDRTIINPMYYLPVE